MWDLLKTFSKQELIHHPWRNAAAVVAIMLGVALAFAVHLINASALDEFSQAARSLGGQADLELRALQGAVDETLLKRLSEHPQVALASPVLELSTYAVLGQQRQHLEIVGVDPLSVALMAPDLMPLPNAGAAGDRRFVVLQPGQVFLNAAAQRLLQVSAARPQSLQLQSGQTLQPVQVAGTVHSPGPALAVMDIGAAQELFQRLGQLSRIDLRLRPGVDPRRFAQTLQQAADWPAGLRLVAPEQSQSQLDKLSRAYRVNLTVLALIALFTGAFLVFSVISLSVAKRAQQFALLGVLGLNGRERLLLVMLEALVLGSVGSLAGLALGSALAATALSLLGGDLGSGFFAGASPQLQWHWGVALLYAGLGTLAALVGAWWPARAAQLLPPAQTLKGLGDAPAARHGHWISLLLISLGTLLTSAPPLWGIPVAAYLSVALLLLGGIAGLPWLIGLLLQRLAPWASWRSLPLLALSRARHQRETAAVAVSGVVASLSLAVALTVMVASFRDSVTQWLGVVLPADLYVRSAAHLSAADTVYLSPDFIRGAAGLPGVKRLQAQRQLPLQLQADLPPVALIARELPDPTHNLPLVIGPIPAPPGQIAVYVSEAVVDLFGARPGEQFPLLSEAFAPLGHSGAAPKKVDFFVAGVWRDYARQSGAITLDRAAFITLTQDHRANDLALWLEDPGQASQVEQALRALAQQAQEGSAKLMEFGTPGQIRASSLRAFDRSFAVTYWLQAVAVAIGLFGIAASFSAQVLARRKEFGLLAHLGLTRRQILTLVAVEGGLWTVLGAVAGVGLGLLVALVLVKVVNPQSFHWSMELLLPWTKLLSLALAVVAAGTVTAWLAARAAADHNAVLAVKEDW
jgi:putative ABC transport system permease protein